MEKLKKNPSLQTKNNKILKKSWWKKNWTNFGIIASSQRKNNGGFIIGMSYVNHFSMWMRMQKWHLMHLQCPEHKNYLDKWQKDRFKSKSKTWSKWTKTIT
jgi:hypothetical protein